MFWDRKKDDQGQQDANKKKTDSTTKAVVEQKLNPELQKLLEKEEEFVDHLYEGSYGWLPTPLTPLSVPSC
jgi:hypothetical protein